MTGCWRSFPCASVEHCFCQCRLLRSTNCVPGSGVASKRGASARRRLGQFEVPDDRSGRVQGKGVLGTWLLWSSGSSGLLASALVPLRKSRGFLAVGPLGHCRRPEK